LKWFRKAAFQGNAGAQHYLGDMYMQGSGVPQDYVQAHMWLNLAVSQTTPGLQNEELNDAVKARDLVASKMNPAQIVEAQKLAREWKPKPRLER